MHSSRMRTVRSSDRISGGGGVYSGGCLLWGVSARGGLLGGSARGGLLRGGICWGVSALGVSAPRGVGDVSAPGVGGGGHPSMH